MSDSQTYRLARPDIEWCEQAARRSLSKFENNPGASYPNKYWSHFKGHAGERAVALWMEGWKFKVDHWYMDESKYGLADLAVEGVDIEIKTWSEYYWKPYGRCVAVSQWNRVKAKAKAIIWCVCLGDADLERTLPDTNVLDIKMMGWNTMADFVDSKLYTSDNSYRVQSYQMPESKVREIGDLYARLKSRAERVR